ncbi:MAG: cytochrome c biogenesis protein CcsA [Deltaproteobacteria bacterium]|nr:cytochrome c biogenesis protein CcsA [Deltaproteobacteria bacterium]
MHTLMLLLASACYVGASLCYGASFSRREAPGARVAPWLLAFAFGIHTLDLGRDLITDGVLPVATFAGGFSFFAWLVVGVYLALQARLSLAVVGALVSPLAFIAVLLDVIVRGDDVAVPEALRSPWLFVHVTLAFLGNAVFALAFAVGAVYLLQERLIKSRHTAGLVRRLPPLEKLDRLSAGFLIWGFPLMTLGIVSGGVWSANSTGHFWTGEPREILAVLTWVLYAGLLQLRLLGGLHGRRAARWTIVAFSLLLTSYVAVNLLRLGTRHGLGLAG